jgi:hypothetical protein
MNSRDDFNAPVKRQLAARVAHKCSNPRCRASTSGPQLDEAGSVNLGVAAHITAASPNGPRFDSSLTHEERCGAENGIWLCQNCAKLIDSDVKRFTARALWDWKEQAESTASDEMGRTSEAGSPSPQCDRASDIKRKLELRDALQKALLKPRALRRTQGIVHPYDNFQHGRVIIRSLDDSSYPSTEDSPGISGWFPVSPYAFYHNGIEVTLRICYAIVDEDGRWRPIDYDGDYDENAFSRVRVRMIGRIPYQFISAYDVDGDEFYNEPHLYCAFGNEGEPYEEIVYRTIGGDADYDWLLEESLRLPDPPTV